MGEIIRYEPRANVLQLELLARGVEAWNAWRRGPEATDVFLPRANLGLAKLRGALLKGANLGGAGLHGADLSGADLEGANLTGADLEGANLSGANLKDVDLRGANLRWANLRDVNLRGAGMQRTQLPHADLWNADVSRARLRGANLRDASLRGANLELTDLSNVSFHGAELTETDFRKALTSHTDFTNTNLSRTKSLEMVKHSGPSSVGIDTLYMSGGKIPEVFLRGCGVPDGFIQQAQALIGAEDGIQFYSCFISYSSKDGEFAKRLHGRLQQEHVRVWFAPEDVQGGKILHEQIDEAIRVYDKLLIVLSAESLRSEWVMTELRRARRAERKSGKRKLFPLRLVAHEELVEWECFDADAGQDLGVEVRKYFIPDFSNWKDHEAFEKGFEKLLRDLRSEERAV